MIDDPQRALTRTADLLGSVRDVVEGRVREPEAPAWCSERGWDAFLLALDDTTLGRCEDHGLAQVADSVPGMPADLLELADAVRDTTRLGNAPDAVDTTTERGASPRKSGQVAAIVRALLDRPATRVVDVGAGHGHLTRALGRALSVPATGFDRDPDRVARARELDPEGETEPVVADGTEQLRFRASDLAVGLHACGELGDAITCAAARDGADVLLVSCCLQKIDAPQRAPLSVAGRLLSLTLRREILGLSNLASRPDGIETPMRTIMEARGTRHALRRLLEARGESLEPGHETHGINRRQMTRGLAHVAPTALAQRGLPPPTDDELHRFEALGREEHSRIRRLSLPRAMLGRLVEQAVVLDRATLLTEAGHQVRVGPAFDPSLSPRNLGILAHT